ncbi:MAG: LTA synthase family protein, partial [Chloroflexi bacterium]|nr:LTA synthase family protein [Chloroflexota bacterium]
RADVLQGLYGYDNTPFITDLQQQGFIVVPQSRANYPRTALSLPSSLNMDYIQNLMPGMEDSPFWWRVSPLISDSRTWEILKEAGYISVAVASDWAPTNNTKADVYLHPKPLHIIGFPAYYIATTPLKIFAPLLSPIAFFTSTSGHRMLINYDFDTLANLPPTSQPKFVFAHIIAPHPPFVFDAQGNPRDPGYPFTFNDGNDFPQSKAVYREAYINQLQYINQRVEDMVESILANATRPTVIIIQSDHGPGLYTDFSSAQNTCLWERLSNFTALYLPGVSPQDVPEDLNAVNIFRLVLNTYLGTDFPMLENRQYYPENPGYIFRLEDVTDEINRPCP